MSSKTAFAFRPAISVNGVFVPTERLTASILDPFSLSANLEGAEMEVDVVDLSTHASVAWIFGVINAGFVNWRMSALKIPLIQEIKAMITEGRVLLRSRASSGTTRARKNFMFVKIRDKTLLVANTPGRAALALASHRGKKIGSFTNQTNMLGWLLRQLEVDVRKFLEDMLLKPDPGDDPDSSYSEGTTEPEQIPEMRLAVDEGVAVLNACPNVRCARWLPSICTFKVTKNNKRAKQFKAFTLIKGAGKDIDIAGGIENAVTAALRWTEIEK